MIRGSHMKRIQRLFFALSLACAIPATLHVLGASAHAENDEAVRDAEHSEDPPDAHEHVTLHSIVAGEEKWQFWGSVVNFLLLVYVIRRLGKSSIDKFLKDRSTGIERGISEAAEVKRAAEAAFATYNERMKTLDSELAKLRKDVADAAERDRARIVAEANDTVARLKAETDTLIQRQGEQLEAQIRREVVAAAAAAAEKAVRELTTPEDQQRLAESFMRELSKVAEHKAESRA